MDKKVTKVPAEKEKSKKKKVPEKILKDNKEKEIKKMRGYWKNLAQKQKSQTESSSSGVSLTNRKGSVSTKKPSDNTDGENKSCDQYPVGLISPTKTEQISAANKFEK